MRIAFRKLDALLRGNGVVSGAGALAEIDFPAPTSFKLSLVLGAAYGACMGLFAVSSGQSLAWLQLVASAMKLPLLFFATLAVTFPALYVFSVLAGSRLGLVSLLRAILASILVMLAVSASLAPVLAFFTLGTTSYSFMVLLNVVLLGVAGLIGLRFLRRLLRSLLPVWVDTRTGIADAPVVATSTSEASAAEPAAPNSPVAVTTAASQTLPAIRWSADNDAAGGAAARHIFRVWLALFALVGVQMSWLLRPFIGRPGAEFTWFRAREASFFQAVWEHLGRLLGS